MKSSEYKVGSYVQFLDDYGGWPKGSISKIIGIWDTENGVVVEHLYYNTELQCNLLMDIECIPYPSLINESFNIF